MDATGPNVYRCNRGMDATVFPDFKFLNKSLCQYLVNDLINRLVNGLVDDGLSMILDQCSFTCLLKRLFSTIFLEFTNW